LHLATKGRANFLLKKSCKAKKRREPSMKYDADLRAFCEDPEVDFGHLRKKRKYPNRDNPDNNEEMKDEEDE
jgi:hypothetical protein